MGAMVLRYHRRTRAAEPSYALSPGRAYAGIAGVCLLGVPVVALLDRPGVPGGWAALALGVMAAIGLMLAASYRLRDSRLVAAGRLLGVITMGLLTALPGYFFGPNAGFAGSLVVMLALAGVLAGSTGVRHPALAGWLTYLAIALGQAAVCAAILAHVIPDASLTPVIVGNHATWEHASSHAFIQVVYLAAFISGRRFQRRYRGLAGAVDEAARAAAVREALLEEARADYRRALMVGRRAMAASTKSGGVAG
jgi:hypothetical protein